MYHVKGIGESRKEFHQSFKKSSTLMDKERSKCLVRNMDILAQYTFFQYGLGAMSLCCVNVAKTEKRIFEVKGERDTKSIHVFVLQRLHHKLMKHCINIQTSVRTTLGSVTTLPHCPHPIQ